ncbi:MAG: DUF6808 domain-containing protein [Akkermansia sp.]
MFEVSEWTDAGWFGCGAVVGALCCLGAVWGLEDCGGHGSGYQEGSVVVRRDTVRRVDTVVVRQAEALDSSRVGTVVRKLAVAGGSRPAAEPPGTVVGGGDGGCLRRAAEPRGTADGGGGRKKDGSPRADARGTVVSGWTEGTGDGEGGAGLEAGAEGRGDSVGVVVPLSQKVYAGSGYRAYVSGFEPRLDSLVLTGSREVVTVRERVGAVGWNGGRLGVGVCAGVGVGRGGRFGPFLGVGVVWRLGRR